MTGFNPNVSRRIVTGSDHSVVTGSNDISPYNGAHSGAGYQSGNASSQSFVFSTKQLHEGKVQSHGLETSTALYGAKSSSMGANPFHPVSGPSGMTRNPLHPAGEGESDY